MPASEAAVQHLTAISRKLSTRVSKLTFADPVSHTYNPLAYARVPHEAYLERYGAGPKEVVFVGMNPGPFGMAQTGVPFGDVSMVRDFLGIKGRVSAPPIQHEKRPIQGFECARREISGQRLWGWVRERFGTADRFFDRFFVVNYCPLAFLEASGRNRTPDRLPSGEREALFAACDEALRQTIALLAPQHVVGIGAFAERRVRAVINAPGTTISTILHPSPASPKANEDWAGVITGQLGAAGIRL